MQTQFLSPLSESLKLCDFSTKKRTLCLSLCYTTSIQLGLKACVRGWENPLFARRGKVDLTASSGYVVFAETGILSAY